MNPPQQQNLVATPERPLWGITAIRSGLRLADYWWVCGHGDGHLLSPAQYRTAGLLTKPRLPEDVWAWRAVCDRCQSTAGLMMLRVLAEGATTDVFLVVTPLHRGQGVGRGLLDAALEFCRGRGLVFEATVGRTNTACQKLNASAGLRVVGGDEQTMIYRDEVGLDGQD